MIVALKGFALVLVVTITLLSLWISKLRSQISALAESLEEYRSRDEAACRAIDAKLLGIDTSTALANEVMELRTKLLGIYGKRAIWSNEGKDLGNL